MKRAPMSGYVQILTTVPNKKIAEKIARMLVEKRLAACVQIIGPIASVYRWKGKSERAREYLLIAKTRSSLYPKIEKAIRALHSYKVPEIIAVPITRGLPPYLRWLDEAV